MISKKPYIFHLVSCLLLVLLIIINYHHALSGPFIFDSRYMMPEDYLIRWFPPISWKSFFMADRYLVNFTLGLNYELFGMETFWYRVFNLFFHCLNALLVYSFLQMLFRKVLQGEGLSQFKVSLYAFLGAFLFALNPVALYGVVYVVQRYILMATFFSLLSMVVYMKGIVSYLDDRRFFWGWFYLSVLCYFLAISCKQHAVMLPIVFVFLTFLTLRFEKRAFFSLAVPYILYLLIALYVTFLHTWLLGEVYEPFAKYAVNPVNQHLFFGQEWDASHAWLQSVLNQSFKFFEYLYLWIVPDVTRMAFDRPRPFVVGFLKWPETFAAFMFVVYGAGALWLLFKKKYRGLLGFGLIYPMILFVTEFSTVRFHENFVLYRSYLWMSGFYALVPFCACQLSKSKVLRWGGCVFVLIYAIVLMTALQHRLAPFESRLKVWEDVVERIDLKDRRIAAAYRSVGNYAGELGNQKRFKEAFEYYKISTELNPHYDKAWYGMAGAKLFEEKHEEALEYLKRAVKENPLLQQGYYWMGVCYVKQKDWENAIKNFRLSALGFEKPYADDHYQLGRTLFMAGRSQESLPYYEKALQIEPDNLPIWFEMAVLLRDLGKPVKALNAFQKVLSLDPKHVESLYQAGKIYAGQRDYQNALKSFEALVELNPKNYNALHGAGIVLANVGKKKEAAAYFQKALEVNPKFLEAQKALQKLQSQ